MRAIGLKERGWLNESIEWVWAWEYELLAAAWVVRETVIQVEDLDLRHFKIMG